MIVAFRTDASLEIGTGHVMRCLTLAKALRAQGAACQFITRALPGHLGGRIAQDGFDVALLPAPEGPLPEGPPAHASWAGVDWQRDASDTRAALADRPDWLVLDHYAFDARWQRAVLPEGTKLMVIDDLADRPHVCDLLLDQNLGHKDSDYAAQIPAGSQCLTGPQFALLRPEFADLRVQALVGRAGRGLRHLLITMGGVDRGDATSRVLGALRGAVLPEGLQITVVMGSNAPALEQVHALAAKMPWPTDVVVDVKNMAARMAAADLAIGAAGATTWERCALGLPSIVVQIADNQAGIVQALHAVGAALDPGPVQASEFSERLHTNLREAQDSLDAIAQRAAAICDGDGVGRVLARIGPFQPSFRLATSSDSRRIWEWRAASGLERFSQSRQTPDFMAHHKWFTAALSDPQRIFRILMLGGLPCGYLRLDLTGAAHARVSICLAPDVRGQKLSAELLAEAARLGPSLGVLHLDAEIHPENTASLRCFEQAGYRQRGATGSFRSYHLGLSEIR